MNTSELEFKHAVLDEDNIRFVYEDSNGVEFNFTHNVEELANTYTQFVESFVELMTEHYGNVMMGKVKPDGV